MLALCSMLSGTYYAHNYTSIIGGSPSGRGHKPIVNRIAIVKLQISSKCTSHSSARTEALLKSSSEIILWRLNMLLKENADTENQHLDMVSLDEEDKQPD